MLYDRRLVVHSPSSLVYVSVIHVGVQNTDPYHAVVKTDLISGEKEAHFSNLAR